MVRLNYIWNLSRFNKRMISVLIDSLFVIASFYAAYWTRIGHIKPLNDVLNQYVLIGTLLVTLLTFSKLGLYRAVLRYLTFHALAVVSIGTLVSATTVAFLAFYLDASVPRSVPIIYGTFLCLLCGGSRLVVRVLVAQANSKGRKKVLIYGAGSAGRQLALALRTSETHKVVGFIDEDKTLENTIIMGLRVFDISESESVLNRQSVEQILLAIPSASRSRRKQILDSLFHLPAEVLTVPDMKDIVEGKASIDELKDVPIEDLLGRDPVAPQQSLMEANIKGKVVMVTGAGGSIGSELCRQIVKQKPTTLLLFELSEFALYSVERELRASLPDEVKLMPILGNVLDQRLLEQVMQQLACQIQA